MSARRRDSGPRLEVQSAQRVRFATFALTMLMTGAACGWMDGLLMVQQTTMPLRIAIDLLFACLFGWIAISFSMMTATFLMGRLRATAPRPMGPPNQQSSDGTHESVSPHRIAIVMPIYNEAPSRVFAAVAAMREQVITSSRSLSKHAMPSHFDFFILSDTNQPKTQSSEQRCWSKLVSAIAEGESDRSGTSPSVYYRHRDQNTGRKAGNIEDFCVRWGDAYDHMVILDADSLVSGETILEMARRARQDPQIGILQVPPVPIGRSSLFARLQQFSAATYGPVCVSSYRAFSGPSGNYWGHNAIIRVDAFKAHCQLPTLNGPASFGGHILSHDFVEAALMVRGGWKVVLADDLGGSFEECPTTIRDYAIRDQRWCHGNLQHWQVMLAEGLHPMSRFHLASGIIAYLSSPMWLLFISLTFFAWLLGSPAATGGSWRLTSISLGLFTTTMLMLLLPKIVAIAAQCLQRGDGTRRRLLASFAVETLFSILYAPINAVFHSQFVIGTALLGRQAAWGSQQRDESGCSLRTAITDFGWLTVLGWCLCIGVGLVGPSWLPWMLPFLLSWMLSVPLAMLMANVRFGEVLRDWGLLVIAQESAPEPLVESTRCWQQRLLNA
ncbi:MAG: glucans biosynthesis glucosyltransferase MdoH [Planctomycetota bacterium]